MWIWLGYVSDMIQGKLFGTEERIARANQAVESMLEHLSKKKKNSLVNVKALASVVGQIISMQSVFDKLVCLRTSALHECIISRAVLVTEDAVRELKFLKCNIKVLNVNGRPLKADLKSEVEIFL